MLPRLLVGFGILIMAYAIYSGSRILSVIHDEDKRKFWYILFLLIIFFLVGYVFYFYQLLITTPANNLSAQLISAIFFFGALFVVLVLSVNYSLVSSYNDKVNKIQQTNVVLTRDAETIQKKDKELEEAKNKLEKKNAELEHVLEDFYMLRLNMQRDMESGQIEKENAIIKEKLDKLKNST